MNSQPPRPAALRATGTPANGLRKADCASEWSAALRRARPGSGWPADHEAHLFDAQNKQYDSQRVQR